ncbi:MAG: AlpA family phage regulatory protein [Alphaproteobacteria bacterium]|nr:AlpA family phage regulatory protein [Alphaproteobacteria bacterium]MBU1281152.1 AlpA family phage regulatory protein [Alphaproteobacteria bacterium]MBU1575309.1 AlpA family phage regulatory protein [Alphaproteobacteria bacterium]MBU1829165.1 AlpA family phage regulatory protein [Alphaproteobacteria bacterium]MBU2079778.1 AlpA family phage regulatory protein [Alphaproteobacteria bacterium]
MAETYITDLQLAARFSVHRSTPWRWAKTEPGFPQPVKLGPQCSRWKLSEIEAWESARAAAA